VRLGVLHGAYCIGCCWTLMVLLFAFGVMNFTGSRTHDLRAAEKVVPDPGSIASGRARGGCRGIALSGQTLAKGPDRVESARFLQMGPDPILQAAFLVSPSASMAS
jgi:hypothetical protein